MGSKTNRAKTVLIDDIDEAINAWCRAGCKPETAGDLLAEISVKIEGYRRDKRTGNLGGKDEG